MKSSYLVKHVAGTLLFFAIIFISAGKINFLPGLIYVAVGVIMSVLSYTVFRIDAELMNERAKPGDGTKQWDKMILGLTFLATIAMYIVGGLDSGRFHASSDLSMSKIIIGIVLTAAGQLIFLIAQKQNKFFSSTVRIQTNRQHAVCDSGVYKFVRHPAYLGSIIQATGFPFLFNSSWSIIPVVFLISLFIIRTYLEDQTLQSDLKGYIEYSDKTRFKIIPFIW